MQFDTLDTSNFKSLEKLRKKAEEEALKNYTYSDALKDAYVIIHNIKGIELIDRGVL